MATIKIIEMRKVKVRSYQKYLFKCDDGNEHTTSSLSDLTGINLSTLKHQIIKQGKRSFFIGGNLEKNRIKTKLSDKSRKSRLASIPGPTKLEYELWG